VSKSGASVTPLPVILPTIRANQQQWFLSNSLNTSPRVRVGRVRSHRQILTCWDKARVAEETVAF
jgi:hypothetical protein